MKRLTGSIHGRLSLGLLAQGYSRVVTIVMQLVSVPILIAHWGIEEYGVWLLISAIPVYLSLADLGFAQVGANEMTMRVARNDRDGAQVSFHTIFGINCAIGAIGLAAAIAFTVSPLSVDLIGEDHASQNVRIALLVLTAHGLFSLLQGVVSAGMRAEGQFALMATFIATTRLFDTLAVITAAWFGGDLLAAALAMLALRVAATLSVIAFVQHRWPWLRLGFGKAQRSVAKRMLGPSLHYASFTLGNLINIQGVTIVVGSVAGPMAVAITSTVRTLTRLGPTFSIMLNQVMQPEYSSKFGRSEQAAFRRLFFLHMLSAAAAAAAYLAFMVPLGPTVYAWWTHDAIGKPHSLLTLLAFASALEILWTALQSPSISVNQMRTTGVTFTLVSLAGLFALYVLLQQFGEIAYGWVALTLSGIMLGAALIENRRMRNSPFMSAQ